MHVQGRARWGVIAAPHPYKVFRIYCEARVQSVLELRQDISSVPFRCQQEDKQCHQTDCSIVIDEQRIFEVYASVSDRLQRTKRSECQRGCGCYVTIAALVRGRSAHRHSQVNGPCAASEGEWMETCTLRQILKRCVVCVCVGVFVVM